MSKNEEYDSSEKKLLLLARSRWTRRVLEEQLMPALGKRVPLFASAQVDGVTTRMQTFDPASLELDWHEVNCDVTARAVRFMQRVPLWRTADAAILAEEMRTGTFEELRVAHHFMETLDVPTTGLEVAHRLAHYAPNAAAMVGRALRMETQMRQVGHYFSFIAQRASTLLSHMGLAVGLTCLVLNSMALNQAVKQQDTVSRASLASSVVLDAASCTLFTSALVAVALKAAKLAAILSTAAIPVSIAAIGVPPLVRHFWTKKKESEAACSWLSALVEGLQNPLLFDKSIGAHHFCPLVPVQLIDFRTSSFTLGSVLIDKNVTRLFKDTNKGAIDLVDALSIERVQTLDTMEEHIMILPLCGEHKVNWSVHFTATAFAWSSCPGMENVSKLRGKGFNFYNGLYTVHSVKSHVTDGKMTILLDNQEKTLALAPQHWFHDAEECGYYDMCYTLVGSGGKTMVLLEKRSSGYNIIRLETDSTESCSTWIIQSADKLNLVYYKNDKFIFSSDGINVVLTEAHKNSLFVVYNNVIYSFDSDVRKLVPKIILPDWIQLNRDSLLENLQQFDSVVQIQDVPCIDQDGKYVAGATICYDPTSRLIIADTPKGFQYTSKGNFENDGEALVLTLDSIDLSMQLPNIDFNLLHHLTKEKLHVWVSHLNLHGYFDAQSGLLLLLEERKMLYAFSNSTAAVVGVCNYFLESSDLKNKVSKLGSLSDPALALFPNRQRMVAEHLLVLNTQNLWILPFEQKFATATTLTENLQLVGSIQDSAIFFDRENSAVYSSALKPLDADFFDPEIFKFEGFGNFMDAKRSLSGNIRIVTNDGLVFCIKDDAQQLNLQEKMVKSSDTQSSMCLRVMSASEKPLVPITEENSGRILHFMDTKQGNFIEAIEDHVATDVAYLGQMINGCHVIFSSLLKKVLKLTPQSPATSLFHCDMALREKNTLLLFDPELSLTEITSLSLLQDVDSIILATSALTINCSFSFQAFAGKRFVLDPLIKTKPVVLNLAFDTAVNIKKSGRELVIMSGNQRFIVHRGQRENISTNMTCM